MDKTTKASAGSIGVSLEWAIEKFGNEFFTVSLRWTLSEKLFRWEDVSTLEQLKGYENVYGDITNYGLAAAMRNMAKLIKGTDKKRVKVYAYRLIARITPKERRMNLPVRTYAMVVTEQSFPTFAEHQQIEIPTFVIDSVNFDRDICKRKLLQELYRMGLSEPVDVEYDSICMSQPEAYSTRH